MSTTFPAPVQLSQEFAHGLPHIPHSSQSPTVVTLRFLKYKSDHNTPLLRNLEPSMAPYFPPDKV